MLANTFTFRSFCIFDARETEWLQLSGNFFGVAALCKLIFASQKLSTLPRENFFPYYIFFSSRRGLLSSRRGLSSSRRSLLSSRRELKNYI